ncbi:antirestriction protein ArdA [Mycolicibacterium wolinskyi]|uniref:antirestriction protein ArdA n=1 Tax=Mycolicibacterium wolinskyi TaxID=59750 RepID=UPI00391782FC
MHDQPPTPHPDHEPDTGPEHDNEPRPSPAIYVASLADYNNGVLHGRWIDAARDPAQLHADVAAMLATSRQPDAEEFAIHDYEQFGVCRIHEYDSLELVARIARGIRQHGDAFSAWADVHEAEPERFDDFAEAYLGHYDSVQDYAEQVADDLGYTEELEKLPEAIQPYARIDTAAMARDMTLSGAIYVTPDPSGGVWVFDSST